MDNRVTHTSQAGTDQVGSTFHIAFCVDNHYFRSMGATITSVIANNPDTHFTFHVLAFDVTDQHRERLLELEQRFNVRTRLHIVDPDSFSELRHFIEHSYYSLSIFSRLIIPALLRDEADKVLYLDADILCVGKLDELIAMDLDNEIAAVVPDAPVTTARRCAALGLKHGRYFNGGVLYMHVANWIANRTTEKTMEVLLSPAKDMRFNDQDALNIVIGGSARFIDGKYNYIYDLIHDLDRNIRTMRPVGDAVFLHFAGAVKPWADWSEHEARALFTKYHALSPWSDMPLDPAPRNSREMRMQARFLTKRGELLRALGWFVRYLRKRAR